MSYAANGLQALTLVALLLALSLHAGSTSAERLDRESCTSAVEEWTESQLGEAQELKWQLREQQEQEGWKGKQSLPELLFFLHFPRAGGKTYHQCFLSYLTPPHLQCNMSYHKLRDDPTSGCRVLATHDDYSMTKRLPPGPKTFVTSLFRDPVDRVISTYEMAAHIAGRSMGLETSVWPDETVLDARRNIRDHYAHLVTMDTRNIWPWSVLAGTMEEDLWVRRDFINVPPNPAGFNERRADMYDLPHLLMPLREFIQLPLAHDVVHNNAVFQLVGITNNSILPESTRLRHCVIKYPELGEHIVTLAKARVDNLAHVGFTDRLEEGMSLLAAMIGRSLSSRPKDMPRPGWKPKCKDLRTRLDPAQMGTLREAYVHCLRMHQDATKVQDQTAFSHFGPLKFSRQARKKTSKDVLAEIRRLNSLDEEVTEYAREVYEKMLAKYANDMESFQGPDPERDCV